MIRETEPAGGETPPAAGSGEASTQPSRQGAAAARSDTPAGAGSCDLIRTNESPEEQILKNRQQYGNLGIELRFLVD